MERLTSTPIRWVLLVASSLLVWADAPASRAEEPSPESGEQARSSTASGTGAERALRSPEDVRDGAIEFAGDLERIASDRRRRLLEEVCPGSLGRRDDGTWRCTRCPGFTSRAGESGELMLEQSIRGNFFDEKRRELFVTYRGCEAEHAAGGGAIVFRRRSERWRVYYRHPGLNPQQCLVFEADKHPDRLVCRVRAESDGRIMEHLYDTGGGNDVRRLVHAVDNTGRCPDNKFISSYLTDWTRNASGEQGHETLVIHKIQRWRELDDDRGSACTLSEAGGAWKRHRKLEIVYQFDGEGLERTDVRKQTLTPEGGTKTASKKSGEEETSAD